jgi:LysM repeat protein
VTQEIARKLSTLPITKRIPSVPGASDLASSHKVQPGDSLWTIARRYKTTVEKLKEANHLSSNRLSIGQRLVIPGRSVKPAVAKAKSTSSQAKAVASKTLPPGPSVPPGGKSSSGKATLAAERAGNKPPADTKAVTSQAAGADAESGSGSDKTITHRVRRGENLYNIARRYKTSVAMVRQWNQLLTDSLHPGDTLLIYIP